MINVRIALNGATLEISGDVELHEAAGLIGDFMDIVADDATAEADAQIDALDTQTTALASAVAAATPVTAQP